MFGINNWYIIFIIIIIILLILAITFIILYTNLKNNSVSNKNVPKIKGKYGVLIGKTGTVLNKCGPLKNDPCQVSKNSLSAGEQFCIDNSAICQGFSYNSKIGTFNIIDTTKTYSDDLDSNIFLKQY